MFGGSHSKYGIACHQLAKRVMSRPALTGRIIAVGDSVCRAAAAGPPSRRALSAVRAHGAELLAEGLIRTGFRDPGYGGCGGRACSDALRAGAQGPPKIDSRARQAALRPLGARCSP